MFGESVAIHGDYVVVGAPFTTGGGVAYVFHRTGTNTWDTGTLITPPAGDSYNEFGWRVDIHGDYIVIGGLGSAYIFHRTGTNTWDTGTRIEKVAGYFGQSVGIHGDYVIVGAMKFDVDPHASNFYASEGQYVGAAYIFHRTGTNTWDSGTQIVSPNFATRGYFGRSVSVYEDYVLVGENGAHSAYIFRRTGTNTWDTGTKIPVALGSAEFGWSADIDGDYTVVGAYRDSRDLPDSGSVSIFSTSRLFAEPTYTTPLTLTEQQAKLIASDGGSNQYFGRSVSTSGDYAIAGAYRGAGINGCAYIFVRSGASWTEQAKLVASDGAVGDQFGRSVSISGDYAIVGAPLDDDNGDASGSAYIFVRSGASWTQQAKLTASDGAVSDLFGYSVSISGDYAFVGSPTDDSVNTDTGSVYIFVRSGASWTQQTKLTVSDGIINDQFGSSVSVSGDYAVVGVGFDYFDRTDPGSAYIFVRSGASWTQQAKLTASDGAVDDHFGQSVSISGDYVVIGAPRGDGSSGSAYVFARSGTSWTQQAKFIAPDRTAGDRFGESVIIHGDYVIVGAIKDYIDGFNIDGSGSAYVFVRSGTSWTQQSKLVASDRYGNAEFGHSPSISGNYAFVGTPSDTVNGNFGRGSVHVFTLP